MKVIAVLWIILMSSRALSSDALERAQRSTFVPSLSLHYAYDSGSSHLIFASLSWDVDENLSPERTIAAIKMARLEREVERLPYQFLRDDLEE